MKFQRKYHFRNTRLCFKVYTRLASGNTAEVYFLLDDSESDENFILILEKYCLKIVYSSIA
jgi:hypothetical protein